MMKIPFDTIEETAIPSFKGGQKQYNVKMFFDGKARIMKGRLVPGASIGTHTHEGNCEVIFITSGTGKAIFDGQEIALSAGDVHYCPGGHTHCLINNSDEDLVFSAVVA